MLGIDKNNNSNEVLNQEEIVAEELGVSSYLDISLNTSSLKIIESNEFKVETNNENVTYSKENEKIKIEEEKYSLFKSINNGNNVVTIYLPKDMYFEYVRIDTKAGETIIENLNAKNVSLDVGAGKLEILSSDIENLNCDTGIGETNVTTKNLNNAKFNTGIGALNLNIIGKKEEYSIKLNSGIGDTKIDGSSIPKDTQVGNGKKLLELNGGIGEIKINFK